MALLLKVKQCIRCLQGTGQGMAVVPEVPVMQRDSERSTIFEEADKYESDVAYVAFTRLVAPFCMITTALSLLQDYEGIPSSLTVGGSNAFPLLISGILLLSEHRPQFRVRLRIWLALALWFLAAQLSYLLARELRLDENMWLNHMVFLTIISTALQLPKLLTWTSAVLHSLAFLALTLFIGEEGEGAPSLGLQVYMFAVLLMSAHYANIVSLTIVGRLKTELDCKEAKMKAQRCEIETAVAQALAHEETLRAQAAETDLLRARARVDALSAAHETVMNLLRSICDAVVQVDNDMNILDSDKLSLLLYQNSTLDLVGTSFKDLLSPLDWQQFQDDIRAVQDGGFMPILARLKGSYDTKIRVAIYVSVLPQADGEVRYFLGITEDEEKLEASPCPTPRIKSPVPSNLSQVLQRLDPAVEEPDLEAALEEAEREDSVAAELELQEFVEEEQMQAMMSFLWTWPLASQDVQDACCDTHHILSRAAVVLQKLEKIPCSNNSSRSFSWQCPACKLMGFQCDKDHFDNVNSSCGRCVNWDQLY